jgi:pimeloyl-ACP methyl ester carboxylesterase
MNYTKWTSYNLSHKFTEFRGKKVSLWHSKQFSKPLVVLVHGLSGDYTGMIPLASELADKYDVVIVELPGHGATSRVDLKNVQEMQDWFIGVLRFVEVEFGEVVGICAHSFGCAVVLDKEALKKPIALLNPVPNPSALTTKYSNMVTKSSKVLAGIYNLRPLNVFRGVFIVRVLSVVALRGVFWVSMNSHQSSYARLMYQAALVKMALDGTAFHGLESGMVRMIICGLSDIVPFERSAEAMKPVFGPTETIFIKGGHIMPIESPVAVANYVKSAIG